MTKEAYTPYEQETIDLALEEVGGAVDPSPEGKRIAGVDVVILDVIEERDPAPNFLNWFHVTSKDYTATRELLFGVGDRYDVRQVNETERNLRGLRQFSLVVILPLRTDDPDEVRLLVICKDIWSLRLNSDFVFRNGQLELLFLQPAEENLFGTHRRAFLNFLYEPDIITLGARFIDPRMAGTRYTWSAAANVLVNHGTGDVEGSSGSLSYGLPLFWTKSQWAWGASVDWAKETTRRFLGTQLATYDADVTPGPDPIPFVYDTEEIGGRISVTRSTGYLVKNDFTLGASADRSVYRAPPPPADVAPAAFEEFEREVVPFSETRNGPFLQWRFYLNQFTSVTDVETMGLQENYLVGPELFARVYPVAQAFGSTRDLVGYRGTAAYTHDLGNGFARAYASGGIEHDLGLSGKMTDTIVQGGVRVVTPSFFIGRLVYDGTGIYRHRNFSNRLTSVGGDGRLRGYPSRAFLGENLVASNLEFRSRPIALWTVLLSGAAFWDSADAFDGAELSPKHGAGFGARILFPQLGRAILRADWGFAIDSPIPTGLFDGLVVTFSQAFGVPNPEATGVAISAN